ncbi:MAG: UDP-2,3-diacylglucosamine diphosphatase [Thiohalophilus sp.]|uniref:UDP-2,3-diacylglucosamine diphosphatase n=1 Tax=Thiohalophilus sp. TaxID=3028392 RepID=UPI00286FDDB6|nr:UDP-2,3-diacylglucosamine diphosphatase [Thiohalophilus sp.]MDR9435811.1 UDP-2,3-diacylglucosamine diphosphatase [Thiohalophilus sp.]
MATLFISDLHLSDERPEITRLFIDFLQQRASRAEALYILGDLFEVWLGDDMILPDYRAAIDAMHTLSRQVPLYVMYGNRDFLMREEFCRLSGAELLPEPSTIDLYGTPTLLLHGDTLCTDDQPYQEFRRMVRDPQWQEALLAKSPQERLALARQYRETSKLETGTKDEAIMDVNAGAVEQMLRDHNVVQMIHGHTHRPAIHEFELDGQPTRRIVLGDWYEQGSVLVCDASSCRLEGLPL